MQKLSNLNLKIKNKLTNLKKKIDSRLDRIKKTKNLPKSKRKLALAGMASVFALFGITLLGSSLPVIAKDVPVPAPNPSSAPSPKQSYELAKALSGAAASVCALAVTSGFFLVGAACGIVVVYGILRVQGK